MADDDTLAKLQKLVGDLAVVARAHDKKLDTLVEGLNTLVEVSGRFDERLDTLAEAQANSETKIAALADAQIKTEGVVAALGAQMRELAAQQTHTDQRLDALIDIVRGKIDGDRAGQA
jgi:peptidoglycan hydrolase CwlO-like protein